MMGVPVTAGMKFLVTFYYNYENQIYLNTFTYNARAVTGAPDSDAESDAIATVLKTAGKLAPVITAFLPSNLTFEQIWIQVIQPERVRRRTYTMASTPGGNPVANTGNLAAVITRYGALANRKNLSSLHIPSSDAIAVMAAGTFTAASFTQLSAIANQVS